MQLVAYGAQDVYLTGNPQVTFFKQLYRRHTNFSMQSVEATFNGMVGWGKRVSCIVPRVGDLMSKVYLIATLPSSTTEEKFGWDTEVGHFLIEEVEIQIGGQVIDKHYGTWLSIWNHLTLPDSKKTGYGAMVFQDYTHITDPFEVSVTVPLQFWFCRHDGLALPLIALQYHEVRIVIKFAQLETLIAASSDAQENYPSGKASAFLNGKPDFETASLFIDYIFLDTDERRKFAQVSHEYLIEQLQYTEESLKTSGINKIKLNFNHPIKELIWVIMSSERKNGHYGLVNYNPEDAGNPEVSGFGVGDSESSQNPCGKALLRFNGHDRFSERGGSYFSYVQPFQHHTAIPKIAGINVYSFALYPELEQPSGTANFSRIDNATLTLTLHSRTANEHNEEANIKNPSHSGDTVSHTAKIFAVNYNVLRIMSGMGGLAYSN